MYEVLDKKWISCNMYKTIGSYIPQIKKNLFDFKYSTISIEKKCPFKSEVDRKIWVNDFQNGICLCIVYVNAIIRHLHIQFWKMAFEYTWVQLIYLTSKLQKCCLSFSFFYLILPTLKRVTIIVKKCDTLVTTKKKIASWKRRKLYSSIRFILKEKSELITFFSLLIANLHRKQCFSFQARFIFDSRHSWCAKFTLRSIYCTFILFTFHNMRMKLCLLLGCRFWVQLMDY